MSVPPPASESLLLFRCCACKARSHSWHHKDLPGSRASYANCGGPPGCLSDGITMITTGADWSAKGTCLPGPVSAHQVANHPRPIEPATQSVAEPTGILRQRKCFGQLPELVS